MKRRQVFLICIETDFDLPEGLANNYIGTAIRRYARLDKAVDYFSNSGQPIFKVREIPIDLQEKSIKEIFTTLSDIKKDLWPLEEEVEMTDNRGWRK